MRGASATTRSFARLAAELRRAIRGEVRFDAGSRALYATDGSNYRQPPIGVVMPRDVDDVVHAVEICRRHEAPIFGRGGGTSLGGQCCNEAVCFDFSKYMHDVESIDPVRRTARVQPGTILDHLQDAAARHGLMFGPDPATHSYCTLGGMVGNDSCGIHSVMAEFAGNGARTSDNIESLDVLTYDGVRMHVGATSEDELEVIIRAGGRRGEIYAALRRLRDRYAGEIRARFPDIPRRVSGYGLPFLLPENGFHVARALVGSESTCVTVLDIEARLLERPAARVLLVLGYPDVYEAGDDVPAILESRPIGLEGMDDRLVEDVRKAGVHPAPRRLLPEGGGWLLVEFGGRSREEADHRARELIERLRQRPTPPSMRLFDDPDEAHKVWEVRESGLAATAHVSTTPTWEGWEDSAVPPARIGEYLRELRRLLDKYDYGCDLYGHFGQGCVHTRIDFDLETAAGIRAFRAFVEEAADLVVRLGGSLSGEHGDGQARGELLPKMFGPTLMEAFREFKAIWDPAGRMNPGKLIDAYRLDEHLRLGTSYAHAEQATGFRYPDDSGSFRKAMLRCVGVGKCRRTESGTMCPSYMVTREEMHTTRGRARLLFEMLEGDLLERGWHDEHVKEALDLCLACKGCKAECPVNVDMATYKAEFLSRYYEGRLRPISAYAFGLIAHWARAASVAPRLANLLTQTPGIRDALKFGAGVPAARPIPAFAREPFTSWFRRRSPRAANDGRPTVILWPDTFNNYFHPETAQAAVRVLERAGFRVRVPRQALCCGRPLYDYGMLDTAKRWLRQTLDALATEIRLGTPVVGLEPSCVAVFRDELRNLFPEDEDAKRLSQQCFMLSELLERHADGFPYPALRRRALVHGHCHHKAVLDFDAEGRALAAMELDVHALDSGCCGMAGAFGFHREHYDVSVRAGERVLLPAVREAPADTLIVTDGFSCREQIAHFTNRRALHFADLLDMAAREGPAGPAGERPERAYVQDHASEARLSPLELAVAGAGLAAGLWLARTRT